MIHDMTFSSNRVQPDAEFLTVYETRSLRDTRELLKTTSMDDAYAFVDTASHPR
jgi:WD repeat-containing protein 35